MHRTALTRADIFTPATIDNAETVKSFNLRWELIFYGGWNF
jgi:hypothetical protein